MKIEWVTDFWQWVNLHVDGVYQKSAYKKSDDGFIVYHHRYSRASHSYISVNTEAEAKATILALVAMEPT